MDNLSYILNWNCNGLRTHFNDIKLLINNFNPIVFSLQETNILAPDPNDLDHEGKVKESPFLKLRAMRDTILMQPMKMVLPMVGQVSGFGMVFLINLLQ